MKQKIGFSKDALLTLSILLGVLLLVNIILLAVFMLKGESPSDGSVDVTILADPDCDDCFNASRYLPEMEGLGVQLGEVEEYDWETRKGKRLVKKYGITKVPTVIFSEELGLHTEITGAWERIGTIADDGSYLLQGTNPPYLDTETGEVKGLITIIYLDDESCDECYDVMLHEQVFSRFGMGFGEERVVDVSSDEGRQLVETYGITGVPTVILQGEVSLYPGFLQVWEGVGRVADDGTAVFTNMAALQQPYKDLESGEVVAP